MRNLKKFLALILAMMMAFSLMVTANAVNEKDNGSYQYGDRNTVADEFIEAVDVLNGMGIMTGDYGNFKGDKTIMRSEMAAVLYRLMTGDTKQLKNVLYAEVAAARFKDVKESDWFAPYIGWCYDAGIMVGSNGYFRPNAPVNGYETLVMVLRAMGYGKNHEYTGLGWNINASSDGTLVGLLTDVNNSHYANTLAQSTRRDVVASIVFWAAQLPTVTWTPSLGYNKYIGVASAQGGNIENPSLGWINFGLTYARGVVVGNQASGEDATKIGFAGTPLRTNSQAWKNWMTTITPNSYIYENNAVWVEDPDGTPVNHFTGNASLRFDWNTDLRLFNHAVRVWFNSKSSNGVTGKIQTYALYDDAVATAIVTEGDKTAQLSDITVANMAGLVDGNDDALNNWDKTKMVANPQTGNAFFNYAFAAMNMDNWSSTANTNRTKVYSGASAASTISALSPVLTNDKETPPNGTTPNHGLYLLISNQKYAGDNVLDVVISLDMTMTKIVQSNVTTAPLSTGVLASNGAHNATTNQYFGVTADDGLLGTGANVGNNQQGTTQDYVTLAKDNLVFSPKTDLGTKVAAIEITGTRGGVKTTLAPGADTAGTASAKSPMTSTYFYQLTENTLKKTDTVIKVDTANNDVYLKSGEVLKQSIFAEDTDATFTKDIEGYTGLGNIGFRLQAGRDYTFTLDEAGHYIYWETPSDNSTFIYATYIDFQTAVASSIFDYPLVYVNTAGEGKQQVSVKSVKDADGTPDNSATDAAMDNDSYDQIWLPKRDQAGAAGGNVTGFVKGLYTGYAKDDNGNLIEVDATRSQNTGFLQGSATMFGVGPITINSRSLAVGAEAVTGATQYFLTENTKFIIVDGAGLGNQTVDVRNGITELMKDCDTVKINGQGKTPYSAGDYIDWDSANYTNMAEMFYYKAGPFEYDQSYDPSAMEIKTLFLPIGCVQFNKSATTSMVFVGDKTATMINANNGNWATQFTVWQLGNSKSVWIRGDYTQAGTDAYKVVDNGNNVFYNLIDSGDKATDGEPIYELRPVADDTKIMGRYWDDTDSDDRGDTVTVKPAGYDTLYKATTFNQQVAYIGGTNDSTDLYNVGNAGIKNLNTNAYPGIADNNLTSLNGASSLYDNIGVPVSCILSDTYVVSFIYVNA
ncbi:MAG: S-layer homology domain-containing protein [Oscillospiraceae bacterium]|nr:S-layer homology domain-containing protein [Oscillospiraceae bacterium]